MPIVGEGEEESVYNFSVERVNVLRDYVRKHARKDFETLVTKIPYPVLNEDTHQVMLFHPASGYVVVGIPE